MFGIKTMVVDIISVYRKRKVQLGFVSQLYGAIVIVVLLNIWHFRCSICAENLRNEVNNFRQQVLTMIKD